MVDGDLHKDDTGGVGGDGADLEGGGVEIDGAGAEVALEGGEGGLAELVGEVGVGAGILFLLEGEEVVMQDTLGGIFGTIGLGWVVDEEEDHGGDHEEQDEGQDADEEAVFFHANSFPQKEMGYSDRCSPWI